MPSRSSGAVAPSGRTGSPAGVSGEDLNFIGARLPPLAIVLLYQLIATNLKGTSSSDLASLRLKVALPSSGKGLFGLQCRPTLRLMKGLF